MARGSRIMTFDDIFIGEVKAAPSLPNDFDAQKLLETLGRHSEPILRRRGWRVAKLVEIGPEEYRRSPNVLGWCRPTGDSVHSEEIRILLRHYPSNTFREFNTLIGTMLHELTHIVHGFHNASFYRLLDELKKDWTKHVVAGRVLDADGFPTTGGRRLGGSAGGMGFGVDIGAANMPDAVNKSVCNGPDGTDALSRGKSRGGGTGRGRGRGRRLAWGVGKRSGRAGGRGSRGGRGASFWDALSPRERAAQAAERRAADALNGFGDEELWPGVQKTGALSQPEAVQDGGATRGEGTSNIGSSAQIHPPAAVVTGASGKRKVGTLGRSPYSLDSGSKTAASTLSSRMEPALLPTPSPAPQQSSDTESWEGQRNLELALRASREEALIRQRADEEAEQAESRLLAEALRVSLEETSYSGRPPGEGGGSGDGGGQRPFVGRTFHRLSAAQADTTFVLD
eukprot:TRINITY_DN24565_c0_g1_i1.p1 TRINITY_DN24565_c0_g1~~TRINITY_DN24565_c0_g1_i1.p1  ORF type:complete len:480 (+),score=82.24 TRINITY_DN24565_c0_g1_i1:81-1442(+)